LYQPDLSLTLALCETCSQVDLDDLVSLLLRIFEARNQTLKLLKAALDREVSRTESTANLFRRNSVTSKLVMAYSKMHGTDYLRQVLDPIWTEVVSANRNYEVDPSRLTQSDNLQANVANLEWLASKFLDAILQSTEIVPDALRRISSFLVTSVRSHFPEANLDIAVGAFIFLRFFCPAMVMPELFFKIEVKQRELRRGMVLVTKVIQNLANNVVFGGKEAYMKDFNRFLETNKSRFMEFLQFFRVRSYFFYLQ
jgi:hypothetical protein